MVLKQCLLKSNEYSTSTFKTCRLITWSCPKQLERVHNAILLRCGGSFLRRLDFILHLVAAWSSG